MSARRVLGRVRLLGGLLDVVTDDTHVALEIGDRHGDTSRFHLRRDEAARLAQLLATAAEGKK